MLAASNGRQRHEDQHSREVLSQLHLNLELRMMLSLAATQFRSKDVVRFQLAFATMMKNNMDGLKKRERKGRKGRKKVTTKHV